VIRSYVDISNEQADPSLTPTATGAAALILGDSFLTCIFLKPLYTLLLCGFARSPLPKRKSSSTHVALKLIPFLLKPDKQQIRRGARPARSFPPVQNGRIADSSSLIYSKSCYGTTISAQWIDVPPLSKKEQNR
jgi:hypothetical protein